MATFDLLTDFDPARMMGFGKVHSEYTLDNGEASVVRTYDSYRDQVTFSYPQIRTTSAEGKRAMSAVMNALKADKMAKYDNQITINATSAVFEISMSRWNFEQIFATELTLRLRDPGNVVARYAPEVMGKGAMTAGIKPSKGIVTLIYDNMHTPEAKARAKDALLKNLPARLKDKVHFGEEGKAFALSMEVATYEALTGQKVPVVMIRKEDANDSF